MFDFVAESFGLAMGLLCANNQLVVIEGFVCKHITLIFYLLQNYNEHCFWRLFGLGHLSCICLGKTCLFAWFVMFTIWFKRKERN